MNKVEILQQLKKIIGDEGVFSDNDTIFKYGVDRTKYYSPNPLAIVFPKNENQVIALVNWANEVRIPLVPSGGRTGYSGSAVAIHQEVVVSFDKMNQILEYNEKEKILRCQPGVITKKIQDFAIEHNMFYPVDFASSGSSQIGGNVATNAGGIKVIRYGLTRNWVYGLNVVTGNGDFISLNHGLIKNATGYDLRHLFIGSEGTLGLITEVTLKLTSCPDQTKVFLFSLENKKDIIDMLSNFSKKIKIIAFEFFSELALNHVISDIKLTHPFQNPSSFYILLEYESCAESDEYLLAITEEYINNGLLDNAIISQNSKQSKEIWSFREGISMSLSKHFPYKYDISVTPSKIPAFIDDVDKLLSEMYPTFEIVWFGHIGDGNLHLNILKPRDLSEDDFFKICDKSSYSIYSIVQAHEGSISAEHGVGLVKKKFLSYTLSEIEINYMRSIKKIFDKNNILNPGKIFDLS